MYNLDFETIKQVMQARQKTGVLHAHVESGVSSLREPCRIEINITSGTIVSCTIFGNSGRWLTGEKAIQELSRLGQLSWTFTLKEDGIRLASPSFSRELSPRRTALLQPEQMNNLSRLHRMVFALADGTKSAQKIAEILSISPDQVNKALNDLQSMGIITTRQQNDKNRF